MIIDQFIWSFQHHFRFNCEYGARGILQQLDADLMPQVFLVGLRRPEASATHAVCVEPETDHWISATDFDGLMESTKTAFEASEDRHFFVSDPYSAKRLYDESFRRTIRDQIASIIRSHDRTPPDLEFTVAVPEVVGDYWVSIVIGLQRSVVERYPRLSSNEVALHQFHKITVPVSIIESVKDCLLDRMAQALHLPDSGRNSLRIESDELMREAGRRFIQGIVQRVDADCFAGAEQLFSNLNIVSSIRYEGAEASGELLLGPRASMDDHFCVQFSQPVKLLQHRRARKLLELAARGLSLHTDSEALYGLVLPIECDREDAYFITIKGHRTWELRRGESSLLRVVDGLPKLPKPAIDVNFLRNDLQRIFPEVSAESAHCLSDLVETAIREKHGTMLVISEAAESEAIRLATQGTPVSPFTCTPQLLQHLTSIDGAILLSTTGVCHAVGVILDGLATADGDPARGARYNSAVRYYLASQYRCVLIVVSEDGDVTIIPSLRPQISRTFFDSKVSRMLSLRDMDNVKRTEFCELRNWLQENQFYLRPEQCDELNPVIEAVDARTRQQSRATVWLVFQPLKGNPNLDESLYFLP